jgi:hypothetical protein
MQIRPVHRRGGRTTPAAEATTHVPGWMIAGMAAESITLSARF